MDQYCALVLLYLFNPVVTSLRAMQQVSELKKVQKILGCKRASLGSLSESVQVFDPDESSRLRNGSARNSNRSDVYRRLRAYPKTTTEVLAASAILNCRRVFGRVLRTCRATSRWSTVHSSKCCRGCLTRCCKSRPIKTKSECTRFSKSTDMCQPRLSPPAGCLAAKTTSEASWNRTSKRPLLRHGSRLCQIRNIQRHCRPAKQLCLSDP